MSFEEPEVLCELDRSWGDKRERLVLEKSEWRGRSVYSLRLFWQNAEGSWRWAQAKADSKGRCWAAMGIKARELRQLGLALIAEADELEREGQPSAKLEAPMPSGAARRKPTPREQRELERFEAERPSKLGAADDSDIPF